MHNDSQKKTRHFAAFAKFGELTLLSDDLDEILTEGCRLVGHALETDLAKVMELQADGQSLFVRAGVGWKPGVVGILTFSATAHSSEGFALQTGEPMISPDIDYETRFTYPPFLKANGVKAVANVIIIGARGRQPFGILQIDSRTPRQFTDEDVAFLRSYANLLAGAVDRLRRVKALEVIVAGRTKELTKANNRLRVEADERGRIEGVLRQTVKMEAIGQLTGGLAHDFNNLLAGISGSLELLRARIAKGQTEALDRYIEIAMGSADRAAALTHRLLAFSGRQTLDTKPTDENTLVIGLEPLFARTIGPTVLIKHTLAVDLWLTLCDPTQLENAVLNLVTNARDALPEGGHVEIETSNTVFPDRRGASVDLPNLAPGDYVALSVTDNGTGMTPHILARAFDPFFTTKPIGQGTGLGLSMVHGFVQQSGGHVHLHSIPEQGTRVSIYLPRHISPSETAVSTLAPDLMHEASTANAVVLVVEDELDVRTIVSEVLTHLGYTVLEAEDGRSGLLILESNAVVDLLLTDVGLPGGINGRQLADAARQRRPDLKVLFMTGYAESAAFNGSQMNSCMQVITKPFRLASLEARVNSMVVAQGG